jgi:hypothetical protein
VRAPLRPLHLDPNDARPDSVLRAGWLTMPVVLTGLLLTVLVHMSMPLFAIIVTAVVEAVDAIVLGEQEPRILEEEDVIEARFVVLGRDFDEELPNREVPLLDTAPAQPSEVPTEETPTERAEETERAENLTNPVEDDILRDVLNRSQVFAEIGEERDREGSPDGFEEGTERTATEGDVYSGRLYAFFRRGWSIPTTLSRDEVQGLTATITIEIGQNLEIVSFDQRGTSGNALFDQSVIEQLTRLQAGDQHIPPPPPEVADQYIGQSIAVRFHGRQAG